MAVHPALTRYILVRIKADQPISTSDAGNGYTEPA
jgi:hypothetical protein